MMVYFDTTYLDYPSADDIAVVMIMPGCGHNCPGCQNPELQKFRRPIDNIELISDLCKQLYDRCKRNETNKVVLSGGDCLHLNNRLLTRVICENFGHKLDICIYTGYDIEYVKKLQITGVKYFKCGKYLKEFSRDSQKTDSSFILASSNQDFYDGNYNKLSNNGILNFKNSEE